MEKMPRSLSDFPVDKRQHQKTAHGTVFQHDDPPKHTCSCAVTNPILRLVSLTDQKLVFQIDGPKKPPATEHVPKKNAGLVGIGGSPWGHKSFYTQGTEKKKLPLWPLRGDKSDSLPAAICGTPPANLRSASPTRHRMVSTSHINTRMYTQ
jgi:hypothetical protein